MKITISRIPPIAGVAQPSRLLRATGFHLVAQPSRLRVEGFPPPRRRDACATEDGTAPNEAIE
jgi:hypothetical protein